MRIKGQSHSLTLAKGNSDFKILILFSSETVGSFETKVYMQSYDRMGMKIYINVLGHMTKMAVMLIYGKNL